MAMFGIERVHSMQSLQSMLLLLLACHENMFTSKPSALTAELLGTTPDLPVMRPYSMPVSFKVSRAAVVVRPDPAVIASIVFPLRIKAGCAAMRVRIMQACRHGPSGWCAQ